MEDYPGEDRSTSKMRLEDGVVYALGLTDIYLQPAF